MIWSRSDVHIPVAPIEFEELTPLDQNYKKYIFLQYSPLKNFDE